MSSTQYEATPQVSVETLPLVSIVIPCYNHGRYLQEAIESVWRQDYPATEVIVVDDGSTDNTAEVAKKCGVTYLYQKNQGLSAARNTGIRNSHGELLLFLDADDWLLPGAMKQNVHYLQQDERLAFVSGGHDKVFVEDGVTKEDITEITSDHYAHLLQGNYIGMHATVMYRRWVFEEMEYDTSLKRCEDYDLFLRIARKFPVFHHSGKIAAYRLHASNMSSNIPGMLSTVLEVLDRQQNCLRTPAEKRAYSLGKEIWKTYYCHQLYKSLLRRKATLTYRVYLTLLKYKPSLLLKFVRNRNTALLKSALRKYSPEFSLRLMEKAGLIKPRTPAIGHIKIGDFNRTKPFSADFGYDRGGPIDRYYIENFLRQEATHINGRVLEIGDNGYTLLFGGSAVTQSDVFHVDDSNPKATFYGDISNAPQIPDATFDCLVITQTLQMIYDFRGALQTFHRILKPGGTLLLTVPGITPIDHGAWKDIWYWSFTDKAMNRLMTDAFPEGNVEIQAYGNVFIASAFLYGMGLPEISKKKLDHQDQHYQVIVTVKAQKAPEL